MRVFRRLFLCAGVLGALVVPARAQQEVIAAIQVHGNTLTSDEDVIQASGLSIGAPFSDALLDSTAERLNATKRFQRVDVLKRFASISDPTQIVVLIRVDDGPVHVVTGVLPGETPHVARRRRLNLMVLPILDAEDGYGVTYGAQFAVTGQTGLSNRVLFPLSWGGDKRAGAEFQHNFSSKLAPRIRTGMFVQRRTHPYYQSDADRTRAWVRGDWHLAAPLHAGTTFAWQEATLLDRTDRTRSLGADLVLDTRLEPMLPGNAIYARVALDRLQFSDGATVQAQMEANGYLGIPHGSVLSLRVLREDMSRSVPPFFKSILGGARTLRGFRAGTAVGDTLATTSAELRIPLTSPLKIGKFGASVFIDAGATYDKGQRLSDQHIRRGVGGGIWATATLFHISLMVAHGIGAGTRVHFDAGLTF